LSGSGQRQDVLRAIEQPVALVDYDPAWPAQFDDERRRLMDALPGTFVDIAHIGSTAVPGMRAKPLIDLLAGVRTVEAMFAINEVMDRIGYTTSPELNASLQTRQWFMRQSDGIRTHHLHVVVHDEREWDVRIGFRNKLRSDPDTRASYLALKEELARKFGHQRDAYTEGKTDFINAVNDGRNPPP
jgi:GrpB-like predicted nucleotidyltransferase (UPF0157 family)